MWWYKCQPHVYSNLEDKKIFILFPNTWFNFWTQNSNAGTINSRNCMKFWPFNVDFF